MPKKEVCGIDRRERVNRAFLSAVFFILTAYIIYTLRVNRAYGYYRLLSAPALFMAFVTLFESGFGLCVLKNKKSGKSVRIYLLSIACAIIVSVVSIFVS